MSFLEGIKKSSQVPTLHGIGASGVSALARSTPVDSSETANSWSYKLVPTGKGMDVAWFNSAHAHTSTPVAILLQYGHGTRNGGYYPGQDYINPALRPVFDSASTKLLRGMVN